MNRATRQAGLSIVVLFGTDTDAGQATGLSGERSKLESLAASEDVPISVSIVSFGLARSIDGIETHVDLSREQPGPVDRLLTVIGAFALRSKFSTISIGRLLNTLGPVDAGRVFWRAVRRNKDALRVIKHADVTIAADMPGVKTAWIALHRGWVDEAYYDHRSASLGETFQLPTAR